MDRREYVTSLVICDISLFHAGETLPIETSLRVFLEESSSFFINKRLQRTHMKSFGRAPTPKPEPYPIEP
jgi:hypothetical protein